MKLSDFTHFDDAVWAKEHYKTALKMTKLIPKKDAYFYEEILADRIKALPHNELQKFYTSLSNNEFRLLPFRVQGTLKNQAEFVLFSRADIRMHSFTVVSKHAFATMFIFNMTDLRVQKEPFVQIMIERMYSNKKGYGARLLQQITKKASLHNVTLSVWNENEKLKDYFTSHGFDFEYKNIVTGHYFSTYNLRGKRT